MKNIKLLIPLSLALGVVLLFLSYFTFFDKPPVAVSVISDQVLQKKAPAEVATILMKTPPPKGLSDKNLPKSLRGTHIDGGFRVDDQGNLIVSIENKRFFDYFLSAVGEESLEAIAARIRLEIKQRLQEPARSQAIKELEGYLAYKAALQGLEQQISQNIPLGASASDKLAAMKQRMNAIFNVRSEYLSQPVQEAFYGDDEAIDKYTLASLQVQANKSLTEQQKKEKVLALEQMLPEKIQKQRQQTTRFQRYEVEENKLKADHATAEQLYQFRASKFGAKAAQRLARLDTETAQWNKRMSRYREQKKQLTGAGLSASDYQTQLKQLREQDFSKLEIRRVKALDSISSQKSP